MKAELLEVMGSDLTVVNAARVSFAAESEEFASTRQEAHQVPSKAQSLDTLWTRTVQFRLKAPVFVARQLVKHQVGLVWNEVSRRYVDLDLSSTSLKAGVKAQIRNKVHH